MASWRRLRNINARRLFEPLCVILAVRHCVTPRAAAVNAVARGAEASCGCGMVSNPHCRSNLPCAASARLLGLDALNFANERKLVIAVERPWAADRALAALPLPHPLGRDAALIVARIVEHQKAFA